MACTKWVKPVRPSRLWWLAVAATWIVTLFLAPWCAFFPLSVVLIPMLMFGAMPLIAFTSEKVHAKPKCPSCERTMG